MILTEGESYDPSVRNEPNSSAELANELETQDSQLRGQEAGQDTSPAPAQAREQDQESERVNKLMASFGRRTNERDTAVRERDQAIAERDEAQRALEALIEQHNAQPTQQQVIAADEAQRAPAPKAEPLVNTAGERVMTEAEWQAEERAGRTFVPVGASRASSYSPARDTGADLLAAFDRSIARHMDKQR